ncbi:MAG: hypothetical protein K9J17_15945 [Flavobacteriales bacterium]|nr:hypothetical protein [Flavobacteriales bacterium]
MSKNNNDSIMSMIGDVVILLGKTVLWITVAILKLMSYLLRASEELLRTILK